MALVTVPEYCFSTPRIIMQKWRAPQITPTPSGVRGRAQSGQGPEAPPLPPGRFFLRARPSPGESYYYVRLIQADDQMAWSSPIWVKR